MPKETGPTDPLLLAIGQFRGSFDRLINQQLERLEALAVAVGDGAPTAPAPGAEFGPPGPGPRKPAPTAANDDNPRRRLDALARHLDDRLRRTSAAGGEPRTGEDG